LADVPHLWCEPGLDDHQAAGRQVPRHSCDRPIQLVVVANVTDRTEQTGDHVESSTKLEVTHVTGMEGNARKAFAGDGQELSVQIEALNSVAVAEKLEVPARAARHVEERSGIGHA
jgi:hypothetical protein